jgi:hypothetical protein
MARSKALVKAERTPAFVLARAFAGDPAGVAAYVRQQSRGPYRQRSLWRLLRVESSSADVLDHAAQGFRLFVDAEASHVGQSGESFLSCPRVADDVWVG